MFIMFDFCFLYCLLVFVFWKFFVVSEISCVSHCLYFDNFLHLNNSLHFQNCYHFHFSIFAIVLLLNIFRICHDVIIFFIFFIFNIFIFGHRYHLSTFHFLLFSFSSFSSFSHLSSLSKLSPFSPNFFHLSNYLTLTFLVSLSHYLTLSYDKLWLWVSFVLTKGKSVLRINKLASKSTVNFLSFNEARVAFVYLQRKASS